MRKNASEGRSAYRGVDIFMFSHKNTRILYFILCIYFFYFKLSLLITYFQHGFLQGAVAFRILGLKHGKSVGSEQMSDDIKGFVTLVTNKCRSRRCSA